MRKLVVLLHASLDGFIANSAGQIDWIRFDEDLADYVGKVTDEADTALYGRITYDMMEGYWPTAGDSPDASKHDIEHAQWVNNALKVVFSRTMNSSSWNNTRIEKDIKGPVTKLKQQPGKNLLLIGSASIAHALMELDLVDEYWINVNPVILGAGTPLFKNVKHQTNLQLIKSKTFDSGVVGLQYAVSR